MKSVVLLAILLPFVSHSQVKIKEKVQIKPGAQRFIPRITKTYDFYSPPLFVGDSSFTVTLNSSLAFSATVSVSDEIGYDETVEVGCVFHDIFNPSVIYDTALAWKGRQPVAWGGNLFQGQKTVALTCNRGSAPPEVQLLRWRSGFDGFGKRHMTGDDRQISYTFADSVTAKDGSRVPVVGAASVSGSSLTSARFSGWKIESDPYIQCRGAVVLLMTPLDGSGAEYSPAVGSDTLTGSFTVNVTARGNYVYLLGAEQEGNQVTINLPQQDECDLVFDPQRGDIPGGVDTAFVTVTGGGISATHKIALMSYGLHFDFGNIQTVQHGEIRQLRAAIRDGCSNDVDYPGLHYYKFELLGNSLAWGVLRDTLTGRSGAVVDSVTSTRIEFDAWGKDTVSPAEVTIRVSVDDGTIEPVTASFVVMPAQMRAILGKKVLSYGDTTSLKIQIQNPDGSWMDKPAAWTGTYTIVRADTFGYLYNLDSSKVGRVITDTSPILIYYARPESQPDSIEVLIQLNLEEPPPPFPFGQLKSSGNVSTQAKVVAPQPNVGSGSGKRPPAKVTGGITFGGAIHWGLATLKVGKNVLKILDHAPWTIWPSLPTYVKKNDKSRESRGADRPGYMPRRSFRIQLLNASNQPVKDEEIVVRTTFEKESGGHSHQNGEKALNQNMQGTFYSGGKGSNPFPQNNDHLKTDQNGIVVIDSMVASEASGKYLITAMMRTDTTVCDTVRLTVRVPGLVEFGTGAYWRPTGNTSPDGQNHPSNHWCHPKMKDSLTAALKVFYKWTASRDGGGTGFVLGVNDMSLEWGGVFDVKGRWATEFHVFHRVGLSVDVDTSKANLKTTKEGTRILTHRGEQLKTIMKAYGGEIYNEKALHFGFDKGK